MADSNKNILITPATGTASEPKIEFTGYDANTISLNVLDNGTLSIEGSAGQLFSVSDSLTGTIFSVNDVSGIPSIEVIDDGTITLAEYSGNVGIGTSSPTSKLDVAGTVNATSFVKSGGTSSQFLKADGSVDSTAYTTNTGTVTSVATGTGLAGGTITGSGTISLSHLGIQSLTDPNADRVMFWDDSAGAMQWLTVGTGLTLSGTTLTNASPNVTTNITTTHAASSVTVNSSDGTNGTVNAATTSLAGVMTSTDKTKLDGIESGATADQTASEILTAIKTVDGSGSGLDADLLDGIDSSRIVYGSNSNKTTNVSSVNTALPSGFYDGSSATGTPTSTWYTYINARHNNTTNNYGSQIACSFYDTQNFYVRNINNGTYGSWAKIWNSSNDGSGSGLDADLLDGQQGSYYQQALVSGTSIKTINGVSVLGSGNISVSSELTDSVSTTSSTIGASATAVKTAYDKGVSAYNLANSKVGLTLVWSGNASYVSSLTSTYGFGHYLIEVEYSTSARGIYPFYAATSVNPTTYLPRNTVFSNSSTTISVLPYYGTNFSNSTYRDRLYAGGNFSSPYGSIINIWKIG